MTDYEKIADWCVSEGVGFSQEFTEGRRYTLTLNREYLDAEHWVKDWRVVGVMIQRLFEYNFEAYSEVMSELDTANPNEILERIARAMGYE